MNPLFSYFHEQLKYCAMIRPITFFLFLLFISCGSPEKPIKQPNIVLILTDDHAKNAMSIYADHLLETPNLDRIGKEGAVFNKCYVTNSICAPSRAAILTGKYSHVNGLRNNQDVFDASQQTFISLLKDAGYQTYLVGKWHLKETPQAFDYYNILIGQGPYYNPTMIENGDTTRHIGYTTDLITDLAIGALENRDTSKPFCLLYWHKAPHRNWMPHPRHFSLFQDDLPMPENFYDDYSTRSNALHKSDMKVTDMFLSSDMKLHKEYYGEETGTGGAGGDFDMSRIWEVTYNNLTDEQKVDWDAYYQQINEDYKASNYQGKELDNWKYQRYIKDYLRCVIAVDENVGRMLDYLDGEGIDQETAVIYSSDQGFYLGEHGWYDKRFMYEESFSTPLCIKYPDQITPGTEINELALNIDLGPTILDFAQVPIAEDMQGESLQPLLMGNAENWRESIYYHYYQSGIWHNVPKHYGAYDGQYKILHYYELGEWEMFDVKEDPMEMNNVFDQPDMEAEQTRMIQELKRLQDQFGVESD